MDSLWPLLTGLFAASTLALFFLYLRSCRDKTSAIEGRAVLAREKAELEKEMIELRHIAARWESQSQWLEAAEKKLRDSFKALSSDALSKSNQRFLEQARETLSKYHEMAKGELGQRKVEIDGLVKPLKESLTAVTEKIDSLEQKRVGAYSSLEQHLRHLGEVQANLQKETGNLVSALRRPEVRGQWGELQLRRSVELAGMLNYCDFVEQSALTTEETRLRPDMKVHLPNERALFVDAKAPLNAYLEAVEAPDEATREVHLKKHAEQLRKHIQQLSAKGYGSKEESTPDFVVMFIPGESFFAAALREEKGLIEYAAQRNVVLATPTTLIALLRAVAYGWKHEKLREEIGEVKELGSTLHERLIAFLDHMAKIRDGLNRAVEAYNASTGSLQSRLFPATRKLEELHVASTKELSDKTEKAADPIPAPKESEG